MPTDEKLNQPINTVPADEDIAAAAQEFYQEVHSVEITKEVSSAEISADKLADSYQQQLEEHDRNILAALDEILSRKQTPEPQPKKRPASDESGFEKFAIGMVRKGAGIVSLSLILMFMGIVVIVCFLSDNPDYLMPLKLSPIAAVLLGLELLIYHVISGKKFRIHIPAIVISALIVCGCGFAAVYLDKSNNENKVEYNNRSIAADIYQTGYKELRHAADIAEIMVSVDLNPDGAAKKQGISSLANDDVVNITVTLDGDYATPNRFAAECKAIIDGYRFLGIPVTNYSFISDTEFKSYRLDVKGLFMQDYTEAELAAEVSYVIIEDFDYIADLEDFVGETIETADII